MTTVTRMTLEEFLALPDFDERRLELLDGEVYEKPMPTWDHGRLALHLGSALNRVGFASVEPRAMIPATADFDQSSPLPDVAFYRQSPPGRGQWMTRPPDVAIEILSPGQSRRDMRTKIGLYLSFGVHSVWLVDQATETVEIYEDAARRVISGSAAIESAAAPGFTMTAEELFSAI